LTELQIVFVVIGIMAMFLLLGIIAVLGVNHRRRR
jgi:hypothetical protein